MKCGDGEYKFASGAVYVGHFEDNVPHGEGKVTTPTDGEFEGTWEKGVPQHGICKGCRQLPSSQMSIAWDQLRLFGGVFGGGGGGLFGAPKQVAAVWEIYDGEIKHGRRDGTGTVTFHRNSSGGTASPTFGSVDLPTETFTGVFDCGSMREGTFTFGNGDEFKGQFVDDVPHGTGRAIANHGFFGRSSEFEGRWCRGVPVAGRARFLQLLYEVEPNHDHPAMGRREGGGLPLQHTLPSSSCHYWAVDWAVMTGLLKRPTLSFDTYGNRSANLLRVAGTYTGELQPRVGHLAWKHRFAQPAQPAAAGGGLFGGAAATPPAAGGGMFGQQQLAAAGGGLFGRAAAQPAETPNRYELNLGSLSTELCASADNSIRCVTSWKDEGGKALFGCDTSQNFQFGVCVGSGMFEGAATLPTSQTLSSLQPFQSFNAYMGEFAAQEDLAADHPNPNPNPVP